MEKRHLIKPADLEELADGRVSQEAENTNWVIANNSNSECSGGFICGMEW